MKRLVLVLGLTGAALVVVPAGPAGAAACSSSGVTVQVDFAALGGGTRVACATGDPSSGVTALRAAGFAPTRAAQEPGYFVCRIDGKPASDPCQRTSPANAYWSYWHGRPGGSWTYSSAGPADYDPAPGTVEGWAFGAGKPPSSPPAAAPAPAATKAPTSPSVAPKRAAAPWTKGGTATRAAAGPSTRPPSASPTPTPSPASSAAVARSASPSAEPTSAPSPSPSPTAAAVGATEPAGSTTSLTGPAIAVALVALLGGAAVVRRRRGV